MRDCGYCSFVCLLENEKDGGKEMWSCASGKYISNKNKT